MMMTFTCCAKNEVIESSEIEEEISEVEELSSEISEIEVIEEEEVEEEESKVEDISSEEISEIEEEIEEPYIEPEEEEYYYYEEPEEFYVEPEPYVEPIEEVEVDPDVETLPEEETEPVEAGTGWDGPVLTATMGVNYGPSGKETYYNLPMDGIIDIMRSMGNTDEHWIREDGCHMLGDYVMIAADLDIRPRGSYVETSLGTGIVCDTGGFIYNDPYQVDIAVTW